MRKRIYSSNAWGYCKLGDSIGLHDIIKRIFDLGFDGFDFLYGVEAYPKIGSEINLGDIVDLKNIMEEKGGKISSVVLVSFDLSNPEDCVRQLEEGSVLAKALDTGNINLLPRKYGITQNEGFKRLEHVWSARGEEILDMGLVVSAENHICFDKADDDIFLIRKTEDFIRLSNLLGGQIRIKFDPAWLLMASDDPVEAFKKCLPYTEILDVKDFKDGIFVTPGTGMVQFGELAQIMSQSNRKLDIAVEVEEHHFFEPTPMEPVIIDMLHKSALNYYRDVFGE